MAEPAPLNDHVPRIVAVLGYSEGRTRALHPVCTARLERAAQAATPDDLVVFSGWARRKGRASEAELMLDAWAGPVGRVVCDPLARTTAENAAQVAALARAVHAGEIVVVTSRWHARRAAALFRLVLRGSGVRLAVVTPDQEGSARYLVRELCRWPLVPFQAARARRR